MANNNFTEAFGKAIQIWNESRNLSCCAAELAKAINVSIQSVYKWKAGGRISMENIGKIYLLRDDKKNIYIYLNSNKNKFILCNIGQ